MVTRQANEYPKPPAYCLKTFPRAYIINPVANINTQYGSFKMVDASCRTELSKRAFSIDEFSKQWGWGKNKTYELINSGKLKSVKLGRRRVITVQQVAEFTAELEGKKK